MPNAELRECWCGHVAVAQWTAFVCAVNVRWTAKHCLFEVGTSKKNTFAMLCVCLTRRTPNKSLFGICSGSPQSCMSRLRSRTDVDITLSDAYIYIGTHCFYPLHARISRNFSIQVHYVYEIIWVKFSWKLCEILLKIEQNFLEWNFLFTFDIFL